MSMLLHTAISEPDLRLLQAKYRPASHTLQTKSTTLPIPPDESITLRTNCICIGCAFSECGCYGLHLPGPFDSAQVCDGLHTLRPQQGYNACMANCSQSDLSAPDPVCIFWRLACSRLLYQQITEMSRSSAQCMAFNHPAILSKNFVEAWMPS